MTCCRLFLSTLFAIPAAAMAQSSVPAGMRLVWSDEFNYQGRPDPDKWGFETGTPGNEAQRYTDAFARNARVENGVLILEARKSGDGSGYTSARINTRGKASWQYGHIEVRAKLPTGRGIWPAIWMMGDNIGTVGWPACGEIDIMEYVGYEPGVIHATVHTAESDSKKRNPSWFKARGMTAEMRRAELESGFHIYSLDWDGENISISMDGEKYLTYRNPGKGVSSWPFDQPFFMLLNVAVGGSWGGHRGIDGSIFPQSMQIDYVRVYQ